MIRIIHGRQGSEPELDLMFQGRKRVFVDRLRWDLAIDDAGREIDEYDELDPLYVLALSDSGAVVGSMRLLPTTGPTLLDGPFLHAFDEPVDIRSAAIWEVTRFCIHSEAREVTSTGVNRATAELCQTLAEIALRSGLTHIIGAYDDRMIPVYTRIGWRPELLATANPSWPEVIYVGLWQVNQDALDAMRARSGITGSVLIDDRAAMRAIRKAD